MNGRGGRRCAVDSNVVVDDDYDVQVGGRTVRTPVTPGRTTSWIGGLSDAEHRVRLLGRTENAMVRRVEREGRGVRRDRSRGVADRP